MVDAATFAEVPCEQFAGRHRRLACHRRRVRRSRWQIAAETPPALHQVLVFRRVEAGVDVGRQFVGEGRVADRQLQSIAEGPQVGLGHLLDLVGRVPGLDVGPERPALHGLRQDHGRRAAVTACGGVAGVHLDGIVTAAPQPAEVLVGEVGDESAEAGIGAEEVLADVGARLDPEFLKLAIHRGVHLVDELAVRISGEKRVPLPAPDRLDDVPAGAAEECLRAPG